MRTSTDSDRKSIALSAVAMGLVLSLVAVLGCSKGATVNTYPVRGMVRLADGTLLRGGVVEFENQAATKIVTARGKIGADGIFELGTFEEKDGALPGTHVVVVIANYQIGSGAERPGEIPEALFDPKYSDFRTTDIEVEVKRQENEVVIELK